MPSPLGSIAAGSENLRGILAMTAAMASFVFGDTIIKLAGRELPPGEMMFLRGLFSSAATVAVAYATGALKSAYLAVTPLMALRTLGDIGATALFFLALLRLPFAEVSAISQFTPLALTAAAAIFLNEPVGWRRWLALIAGLAGVLIIIRPGGSAFDWAALFVMGSVLCVTTRDLLTRHIGLALPALLLASISAISVTAGGLMLLPLETWKMPSAGLMLLLAASGVTVFGGNYWTIMAMRTGEMAVVSPFRYAATPFAVVSGYLVFSELPDRVTFIGIGIVIGAGLYTLHRERVRRRASRKTE
ncbi:MAG: DMT family transporter [Hyphomicrobiaceae bacterium]|nr:DMT family transporter [Hyphomicrobiaceae bacterium]